MSVPLSQVLSTARTYLNDDAASQFPDPVLIPKAQEAHRELQEELWAIGSPLVRGQTSPLAYTSGTSLPTLPTDFLCPTALFENASGSLIATAGWTPMTECFYIPLGTSPGATLGFWSWQEEAIVLVGAASARAVVVQYRRQIPIPALNTDLIGILFGESYLAPRTAAIAAGTLGGKKDLIDEMDAMSKNNLAKIIAANRGSQRPLVYPGGTNLAGVNK